MVASAFQSAGQRCSALRMLYVQETIAKDRRARDADGRDGRAATSATRGRFHRRRPGDRRRGQGASRAYATRMRAATCCRCCRAARGTFVAPHDHRVGGISRARPRDLRPGAARLRPSAVRARRVIDASTPRLRPHLGPAHPHRRARRAVSPRRPRRQHLRQPQPDRRGGRRAALRRRGPVGHRAEGGRAALPAPRRGASRSASASTANPPAFSAVTASRRAMISTWQR
jgi:hypothetical protein